MGVRRQRALRGGAITLILDSSDVTDGTLDETVEAAVEVVYPTSGTYAIHVRAPFKKEGQSHTQSCNRNTGCRASRQQLLLGANFGGDDWAQSKIPTICKARRPRQERGPGIKAPERSRRQSPGTWRAKVPANDEHSTRSRCDGVHRLGFRAGGARRRAGSVGRRWCRRRTRAGSSGHANPGRRLVGSGSVSDCVARPGLSRRSDAHVGVERCTGSAKWLSRLRGDVDHDRKRKRRTPIAARASAAGAGDSWTYEGSDPGASITLFVPVGTATIRIAGGQRAGKATNGIKGTAAAAAFAADIGEWRFQYIDVVNGAAQTTLRDSRTQAPSGQPGWRPPPGDYRHRDLLLEPHEKRPGVRWSRLRRAQPRARQQRGARGRVPRGLPPGGCRRLQAVLRTAGTRRSHRL